MLIDKLNDNNLIICPNVLKKSIIQEINASDRLISYKIMDINEFMENYFFTYTKKTIFYLINKYNLNYEIALEYISSFYYLENKEYKNKKLNDLVMIKKELIDNNLLVFNDFFKYYLENISIYLYGYDNIDEFYLNIFNNYSNFNHIKLNNNEKEHIIYEFDDIEDEIAYVCHDIKNKLDQNIPVDKIKLVSLSSEYNEPLKRIFKWCHIPVELNEKVSLYDISIGKLVLELIKENNSFDDIIKILEEESDNNVINQIINIFNEYIDFDVEVKLLYDMVEYDLKHTYIKNTKRKNVIDVVDLLELSKDDYAYLLGFNKENYPVIYKDEEFINDNMKEELKLFTSNQKNINSLYDLKLKLNQDTNLIITSKLKTAFNQYNQCILANDDNFKTINNPDINLSVSNYYNQIVLAKEYDNYYKFGIYSDSLDKLRSNYKLEEYRSYDNRFNGINIDELHDYIKKPFTISYSTIDNYYRCGFRYYLSNILKIDYENVDDFYMNIGNIFHYVLSKCFDNNFDFDKVWNEEANKYEFTFSKLVLLDKLKSELKYDIEIIKKHKNYSYFDSYLYEKRFQIQISNLKNIPVNFVGIVDKISYLEENGKTYAAIIDYKTGTLPSDLNNIIYGIGMQLPIYLYFLKHSNIFNNLSVVGFYLQKIINKEMKRDTTKTLDELKENALKLVGYSIDNESILEKFDFTYNESQMIQGLKTKKEGFYAYSKVLSGKQMDEINNIVDTKIKEATNNILDGKFDINPKKIGKDIVGCEFCSYRDICYKTEKDVVELKKHSNLDFLGGDTDAKLD